MVTLQKNIPMKAGLGGGSSDAAAALLGLRRLWKVRVPDERIHEMAATLGSDVPFFLVGGTALGIGRGDEVYALESLPRYSVVLVIPPFGVATKDAYEWFDERGWTASVSHLAETWLGAHDAAGERFGSTGDGAPPGYWPIETTVYGAWGADGRDVGQRLHGVRRLQVRGHRASRRPRIYQGGRARADRAFSRQVYPP